jgi:uncharacterized protein YciI
MRQRFIVVHSPGPAWQPGVGFREQPGVAAHAAHYRAEFDAGRLVGVGPFTDAAGGGMVVYRDSIDEAHVRAHAAADPTVASGLLRYEVRAWLCVYGDL